MGSGGFRNTKYFFSFIPDRVRFTNCRTWFKAFFFGYLYIYFIKTMLRNFLFILITILWIINLIFLPNFCGWIFNLTFSAQKGTLFRLCGQYFVKYDWYQRRSPTANAEAEKVWGSLYYIKADYVSNTMAWKMAIVAITFSKIRMTLKKEMGWFLIFGERLN